MNKNHIKQIIKEEIYKVMQEGEEEKEKTYDIVVRKVVDEIPGFVHLLPKKYKSDKSKINLHNKECEKADFQVKKVSLLINDKLSSIKIQQPTDYIRMFDRMQILVGGKMTARMVFRTTKKDIAEKIFDISKETAPDDIEISFKTNEAK